MDAKKILVEQITEQVLNELENKSRAFKTCSYLIPPDKHESLVKLYLTLVIEEEHLETLQTLSKTFLCTIETLVAFFLRRMLSTMSVKNKILKLGGIDKETLQIIDALEETKIFLAKKAYLGKKGIKKKEMDKKIAKLISRA